MKTALVITKNDFEIGQEIFELADKLDELFDNLDFQSFEYIESCSDEIPISDKNNFKEIFNQALNISDLIKKLSIDFKAYYDFSDFQRIVNNRGKYGKNLFVTIKELYYEFYNFSQTEFSYLEIEEYYIVDIESSNLVFLKSKFSLNEFVHWINNDGFYFIRRWLSCINKELKVEIKNNELNIEKILEAIKSHDKSVFDNHSRLINNNLDLYNDSNKLTLFDYRTIIEQIALLTKNSVKYKLPFFKPLKNEIKNQMLSTDFKRPIKTSKSVWTVKK